MQASAVHPLLEPQVLVAEMALLSAVLVAIIGAVSAAISKREIRDSKRDIRDIKAQVVNSHDSNLREDIDELRDLVERGFRNLQEALTLEQRARLVGEERVERRLNKIEKDSA